MTPREIALDKAQIDKACWMLLKGGIQWDLVGFYEKGSDDLWRILRRPSYRGWANQKQDR